MIISYFTIDSYRYFSYPKELENKNFSTLELCRAKIKEFYKFEPFLSLDRKSFDYSSSAWKTYKTIIEKRPIYKKDKATGKFNDIEVTVEDKDYTGFGFAKREFEDPDTYLYGKSKEGWYELKYDNFKIKDEEESVLYSCEVFIKFVKAERKFSPEVKTAGLPYNPAKTDIIVKEESDWMVLYICDGKYGIHSNLQQYYATKPVKILFELGIQKHELEILES